MNPTTTPAHRLTSKTRLKLLVMHLIEKGVIADGAGVKESIVRLGNILYLIDTSSYKDTGKTITGSTYRRYEFGAMPDDLESVLVSLVKTGYMRVQSYAEYMSSVAP